MGCFGIYSSYLAISKRKNIRCMTLSHYFVIMCDHNRIDGSLKQQSAQNPIPPQQTRNTLPLWEQI